MHKYLSTIDSLYAKLLQIGIINTKIFEHKNSIHEKIRHKNFQNYRILRKLVHAGHLSVSSGVQCRMNGFMVHENQYTQLHVHVTRGMLCLVRGFGNFSIAISNSLTVTDTF